MIKNYKGLSTTANYEVNLNKICNSFDFKRFISSKFGICPNGLTISCFENDNGSLTFMPEIKYYGYDSSSNNGTPYSDLSDYSSGPAVESEMGKAMLEYLKENETDIYNEIMLNTFSV